MTETTTPTASYGNETSDCNWQKTIDLPTGCTVRVDETRSLVELPIPRIRGDCGEQKNENAATSTNTNTGNGDKTSRRRWKAISSAIWKGGLRSFDSSESSSSGDETKEGVDDTDTTTVVRVFNYKVPSTYDGLNPEPKSMLKNAIRNEYASTETTTTGPACSSHKENDYDTTNNTIGIMTAASMKSLRTATRSAGGIVVDVIVTAGISNARAAGAAADFFGILPTPEATTQSESEKQEKPPPGTINTVVVINGATLTQEAMIEAYAITIEAKCGACAEYSLACAKNIRKLAQGTGTDCAVLLCPSLPPGVPSDSVSVAYAGKHCLLAELIGQAVKEATGEAILSNLHHLYGNGEGSASASTSSFPLLRYHWNRTFQSAKALLLEGARPCVPEKPMDPVPRAPLSVLGLGGALVLLCYGLHHHMGIPRSATVLLAAAAWDRCLPEPPFSVHPVVLAGTMISLATKQWIPNKIFENQRPLLGFGSGLAFLVGTLGLFVSGAHVFLWILQWAEATVSSLFLLQPILAFGSWVLEVLLFKTTFSLQLLCTIALQMAGFLERSKLQEARAQLSWLCSRDPTHLNSEELAGGTLESLSENLSDGTVAPWFWYVLFGPVGALGYRVANTLDSRIGYRGGRYEWFGKASARFDDLINLIPARLTALLLCVAAQGVDGCSFSGGLQTAWEDRRQCSSPNAGWPMGAMAGILGVRLEKRGEYCLGKTIPGARGPTPWDIRKGHRVAQRAGGLALVVAVCACSIKEWMIAS